MIDLNTLIPANSGLLLTNAFQINDRGEIIGVGLPAGCQSEGEICAHAFLLIPSGQEETEDTTAATQNNAGVMTKRSSIPTQVITPMQRLAAWRARLAQRYHIPGLGVPRD